MIGKPLLVVTVTASTTVELRQRRDSVVDADLIELRLDGVSDLDVAGALAGRKRPVIVTCRPTWEGGLFHGSEEERRRILGDALTLGADYVDVEWRAGFADLIEQTGGRRIVLSFHDFLSVPPDLVAILRAMQTCGAEIVKLATRANRLTDCLPLLTLHEAAGGVGRLVLIAMGEAGLASRVLAARFGSVWTYAGQLTEVGQVGPGELLQQYRLRSLDGCTDVYGLVGSPVSHSVSPAMHNAAFQAAGNDAVYLPLPAADVDDFVTFARAMKLKGASVTIPYKVELWARVDERDEAADRIGAINTVRITNGRWLGRNTDASGFLQPLLACGEPLRGTRVAILGAGGSARAVTVALSGTGAELTLHTRQQERARGLAALVAARTGPWPPAPGSWDVLVNCTPVGMYPHVTESPVPAASLTGDLVYDLVYNPSVTRLLHDAAARGCRTIGGLDMLVAQAAEQFAWWTGAEPEPGVMRAAAINRLSEFSADANHVV